MELRMLRAKTTRVSPFMPSACLPACLSHAGSRRDCARWLPGCGSPGSVRGEETIPKKITKRSDDVSAFSEVEMKETFCLVTDCIHCAQGIIMIMIHDVCLIVCSTVQFEIRHIHTLSTAPCTQACASLQKPAEPQAGRPCRRRPRTPRSQPLRPFQTDPRLASPA